MDAGQSTCVRGARLKRQYPKDTSPVFCEGRNRPLAMDGLTSQLRRRHNETRNSPNETPDVELLSLSVANADSDRKEGVRAGDGQRYVFVMKL